MITFLSQTNLSQQDERYNRGAQPGIRSDLQIIVQRGIALGRVVTRVVAVVETP